MSGDVIRLSHSAQWGSSGKRAGNRKRRHRGTDADSVACCYVEFYARPIIARTAFSEPALGASPLCRPSTGKITFYCVFSRTHSEATNNAAQETSRILDRGRLRESWVGGLVVGWEMWIGRGREKYC